MAGGEEKPAHSTESRCCWEITLGLSLMVLVSVSGSPEDFIATRAGLFQTKQPGRGVNF